MATFPVPRSPNPACRFPAPGSPVGSCTSHTGDEFQQGSWPHGFGREELHGSRLDCGCGLACQQACRRLDGPRPRTPEKPPPPGTRPSLPHVMRPGSPAFSGVIGHATPDTCRPSTSFLTWGPFPRPVLLGVASSTDPSATLPAQPAPHGGPVDACTSPTGLPVLPRLPSSMHAGATTPAGAVWCMCRFSSQTAIGLPLTQGGSAPALPVSRPARRSLHAPACMVAELLNAALLSGVLQSMSLPPRTAPAATSRKDSCWVGFAPTRKTRLSTAHLGPQAGEAGGRVRKRVRASRRMPCIAADNSLDEPCSKRSSHGLEAPIVSRRAGSHGHPLDDGHAFVTIGPLTERHFSSPFPPLWRIGRRAFRTEMLTQ